MRGLFGGLAALVLLGAVDGCTVESYCFSGCVDDFTTGGNAGFDGGTGATGGTLGGLGGNGATGGNINIDAGCEGVDLQTDPDNCGRCGNRCELPGASSKCEAGVCVIDQCAAGFYDIDPEVPGCEYACPVAEISSEICDGVDNDCDKLVDLDDPDLSAPADFCNTTAGTPCATTTVRCDPAVGFVCDYPTGTETSGGLLRPVEALCDGIDGNCDGQIDESFQTLGESCDDGGVGVCRRRGTITCDPADTTATRCELGPVVPPSAEVCNDLDDDCNGRVDDGVVFDMVPVPSAAAPTVFVDRFEASRHDATGISAGRASSIACVKEGVLPWTAASWTDAKAACESRGAGYRLCTAAELRSACAGTGGSAYPYGASYEPDSCNGVDFDGGSGAGNQDVLLPTGARAACVTPAGIRDLSGNATEWTSTKTGTTNTVPRFDIYQLHGGSYLSPSEGLQCNIPLAPRAGANAILGNVGFRCCRNP